MKSALVVARVPFLAVGIAARLFDAAKPFDELRLLLCEEPCILPAIYIASPSLHDAIERWLKNDVAPPSTAALRAMIYVIRMSARCTPYGLFAGIGEIAVGKEATLQIGHAWRSLTRPDMGLALDVAKAVSEGPRRSSVRYVANQSVIERGDRIHAVNLHLANRSIKNGEALSEQRMASMRHTAAVRELRALSAEPIERGTLAKILAERLAESEENGVLFVDRMIEAGILISEFDLAPLGNPQRRLASRLRRIDEEVGSAFSALLDRTEALDALPVVNRAVSDYRHLANAFVELAEGTPATPLHVDLVAPFEGTLSATVLHEVRRAAELLERTAQPLELRAYRERFVERYEGIDRMVPLLELIDADFGLGSPDNLKPIDEMDPKIDRVLRRIAFEAEHAHRGEVELSDDELAVIFPKPTTDRPRGDRDIGFTVLATSIQALQDGDFRVSARPMGSRATQSMGRFSLALGDEFTDRMQTCARAANERRELTAELVYPTFGRMYNVSTRPSTADVELHIGVGDSHKCSTVLSPSDLWVGLEGDRFFLWSLSLQKRIRIVESHLFVTAQASTNLCRFLSLLGYLDRAQLSGFRWGTSSAFRALPRITHRRLILSPRTWNFDVAELGTSLESTIECIANWRTFWELPRYVFLCQEDHLLMLDFDSSLSAHLLHDQAVGSGAIVLIEMLEEPSRLWIEGPGGKRLAEFVAALPAEPPMVSGDEGIAPVIVTNRKRFGPGSEWTYAKFYLDRHATDSFIATDLSGLVAQLQEFEVDRWFFLRYADPATHVRLRVRSRRNPQEVLRAIARAAEMWVTDRRIDRCAFDTYDPEYERYGGPGELDAVEAFWSDDSEWCVELLKKLGHTDDDRIAAAAASFDAFLRGTADADAFVIETLGQSKRLSVNAADRATLRSIQSDNRSRQSHLAQALDAKNLERRLGSLLHLHCNRLGVVGDAEQRVSALVRSAALGRRSRAKV